MTLYFDRITDLSNFSVFSCRSFAIALVQDCQTDCVICNKPTPPWPLFRIKTSLHNVSYVSPFVLYVVFCIFLTITECKILVLIIHSWKWMILLAIVTIGRTEQIHGLESRYCKNYNWTLPRIFNRQRRFSFYAFESDVNSSLIWIFIWL